MAQATLSDQEVTCTNFSFPSHGNKILQGLNKQRLDSSLCDVTITVQGQQYKAHKSVLAAYSPYFHGMFTVNWLSSEGDLVMELDGVTSHAFDSLLKLIYTSVLTVSPTIISEVVSAATYLDMPDVVAVCNQYMEKNATAKTIHPEAHGTGPAGLEVGDSDDDDVGTEPTIFANAEDDWTVNLQDISTAARSGEASMKHLGGETVVEPPKAAKKKRRWKDEHGSFTSIMAQATLSDQEVTCTNFSFPSHGNKILQGLNKQRLDSSLCDVTITVQAAGSKALKAGIVKLKKKKKRWETRDPIDGSRVACTCGAVNSKDTGDRCGSRRCPCYRQYRMCSPKCYCKHCINNVPLTKADREQGKGCSCGKNDKKRVTESSVERCVMSLRCACFIANRPCGRSCACFHCGNKSVGSVTTAEALPNGDGNLVKESPKLKQQYDKYIARHRSRVAKGSVADMLEKVRTLGTMYQEKSPAKPTRRERETSTEDQTNRTKKSQSVGMSKPAEEQDVRDGQDHRNVTKTANQDAQTIDNTEVASAVAGIQSAQEQAESVTPAPVVNRALSHSQAQSKPGQSVQGKGCRCGKNDKKRLAKSADGQPATRCVMELRCSCLKANQPCGIYCGCSNCGNKADGSGTTKQASPKGGGSLIKERLKLKYDSSVAKHKCKAPKGSVADMLEKMRTSGTTKAAEGQAVIDAQDSRDTNAQGTEVASAVAGIQSSQTQAEPARLLPAVQVPLPHSQAPTVGGVIKWLCIPGGTVVPSVKVTGPVHALSSNNTALASNSGPQPVSSADTDSQHLQKTSEAQQTLTDQAEGAKEASESPTECVQSRAGESLPDDHIQSSTNTAKPGQTENRVRASPKRTNDRPDQSLQPAIVLKRLCLRSSRVNVHEVESMDENASKQTSTPSQSNARGTSIAGGTHDPSPEVHKGRTPPKKRHQKKKNKPVGKPDATNTKEGEAKKGHEPEDVGMHEGEGDTGSWSSRLRRDRKRTWISSAGEWVSASGDEDHSDSSVDKDYTANSDSSSESDVEEESEAQQLDSGRKHY
uniref:BTB domain-containing protein n=1 Tax=Branchiostoma floridae TaxID=7739 RepID=C3ZD39_BRAFL|eukprot:XP_002593539.1 hypothetical protein BRAFLDRAFT_125224 [Branchiostoma floridae]